MDLVEASNQPMVDLDLGLAMVFNGATYNCPGLRGELESLSYRFFPDGDTETLLKGYHAWGADLLPRLSGILAFAAWECNRQRLFLTRDRLGIKPLYYSLDRSRLRFASSPSTLLKSGDVASGLDPQALNFYLSFHAVVPTSYTLLEGVRKLLPATRMGVDLDRGCEQRTWWTLGYDPHPDKRKLMFDDWQERVLGGPRETVAIRQCATREAGALSFGGVDSNSLVGLLHEVGVDNLLTFSTGLEDAGGERDDELQHSDLVTEHCHTHHYRLRIDGHEVIEQLPAAFRAMSESMVSHDCIVSYLLAREVSKRCEMVQSGQSAGELSAGYHRYPKVDGADDALAAYRVAFFDRDHEEYLITVDERFRVEDIAGCFVHDHFVSPGAKAAADEALHLDSTIMLADDPVKWVDNMTMAWGLEARVLPPDYRLVKLSACIPTRFKLGDDSEQVFRGTTREVIPNEVIDRPKDYFPVPSLKYLQGRTHEWVRELLLNPSQDRDLFQPATFDRLLGGPDGDLASLHGSKLWQLTALSLWPSEQKL